MSNNDDDVSIANTATPPPKRRRTINPLDDGSDDDDDDDDHTDSNNNNNNNNNNDDDDDGGDDLQDSPQAGSQRQRRAALLQRRAAERRRQRLQAEVADLVQAEDFAAVDDEDQEAAAVAPDSDQDDAVDQDFDYADTVQAEEEEEEGEDLLENAERDYQRIEALDHYGTEGLDDRDYDAMDLDQRRAAEAELDHRDRATGRNDGLYGAALDTLEAEEDEDARRARRGFFAAEEDAEDEETDEEDLDGEDRVNIEAFDVPLREWISQQRTRKEIQRKFRVFLRHFTKDNQRRRRGNGLYEQKIRTMCASNLSALQVSYVHLSSAEPLLGLWLAEAPKDMLDVLNEAATRHTLMMFPSYGAIHKEIHVRISEVPIVDSIRDLRREHLDRMVKVHGVVTRRSNVYPQLRMAYYRCSSCKTPQGPFRVEGYGTDAASAYTPDECPRCEGTVFFKLDAAMSQYSNYQRVNLQETPGSVPPGRVPRTKEVLLTNDLIDNARPGEEIEVTGVYEHAYDASLTFKSGFPVFSTFLTANHVRKREDASSASNLSEADVRQILDLAKDPRIGDRIVQSIAPSIFGHDNCKMALAMSLFGGVPKNINDKHRIRGDCNVLLLGDPGTAKSQLLKYAEITAPRAVYSTGKGASAVGLTAGVHKDPITKEWTLEGGALVLADKGVALIDEFDKMNEQDRTSIHEAMEQQSISVSKAGIVTSLQARCSVIAAANPIGGRYDSSNTLADNVELTDPILQRFDILCVLQDVVDPVADERLATFVSSSHMNAVPTRDVLNGQAEVSPTSVVNKPGMIDQELLRKYIQYARTNVRPNLRNNAFDQEKVASLYVALRRESANSGGVPIAVRHVESIMRMAEAHAKMHLRDYVRDDDMDVAIKMMLESFIVAQKFSVRRSLRRSFAKFVTNGEDRAHLLLHLLQDMMRKEQMYQVIRLRQKNQSEDLLETLEVPLEELESRSRERRIYDVMDFCRGESFREAGYVLDEARGVIMRRALQQ
eukprot:Nitzschia sp. Nitz4//scaffold46_size129759//88941//92009//NITZ4_003514-RA/size129759-processed-gene-0.75-mRNA-1//-1//CDS//3329552634//6343//frame0